MNYTSLHELFPTPFTDKALEGVGGHEIYSFMDGFSGYHHIRITKEDRQKTIFVTECGCFQYIVKPFVLNNALNLFSRLVVVAFKEFIHNFLAVYMDN